MDKDQPGPDVKPHLVNVCPENFVAKPSIQGPISNQHVMTSKKLEPLQCSECFTSKQLKKVFSTRRSLKSHIRQCHGEPRFQCQVCFKPFVRLSNLKQHMHVHSLAPDNNKHKCDFCQATFVAKSRLKKHLFQVHKRKVKGVRYFKCEFCPQEFVNRNYLECHVVEEHVVDKEFECSTCSKKFIDQHHLDQHMKKHNVGLKHFCQVCSDGFRNKRNLSNHLKVKHSLFYCSKCFISLSNKLKFSEHLNPTTALEFKCEICSDILNSQCNLNIHTNSHSKEIKMEQTPKNVELLQSTKTKTKQLVEINCDLCLKSFDRESHFKSHRIQVHPKASWTCNFEQCSKTFKRYYQLKEHKAKHSNGNKFKCAICPQYLTSPKCMNAHIINQHGGPRPFKCPVKNCAVSCFSYSMLRRHSLVCDQAEKPDVFKCQICKKLKTFKTSHEFKQHLRRHFNATTQFDNVMTVKACDHAVFVCSSNKCSFQSPSEKEVALHYNQQHGLPTVALFLTLLISK